MGLKIALIELMRDWTSVFSNKAVPVSADVLLLQDSAAGGAVKNVLIGDLLRPVPSQFVSMSTDFMAYPTSINYPWYGGAIASGTGLYINGIANHPGIVALKSSATVNSGFAYTLYSGAYILAGGESTNFIFKPVTTADTTIYAGMHSGGGAAVPGRGAWINIAGTTLSGICKNAAGSTSTGTTYTITATVWYRGLIVVNSDATRVDFYLFTADGTLVWTDNVTANIPTAAGQVIGHGIVAVNAAGGTVELVWIDYMDLSIANRILVR